MIGRPDFTAAPADMRRTALTSAGFAHLACFEYGFRREALADATDRFQEASHFETDVDVVAGLGLTGAWAFRENGNRELIDALSSEVDKAFLQLSDQSRHNARIAMAKARIGRELAWATGDGEFIDQAGAGLEGSWRGTPITTENMTADDVPYMVEEARLMMVAFQLWPRPAVIDEAIESLQACIELSGGETLDHSNACQARGEALALRYYAAPAEYEFADVQAELERAVSDARAETIERAIAESILGGAMTTNYEETGDRELMERAVELCEHSAETLAAYSPVVAVTATLRAARARRLVSERELGSEEVMPWLRQALALTEGATSVDRYHALTSYAEFLADAYARSKDEDHLSEAIWAARVVLEAPSARLTFKAHALRISATLTRAIVESDNPRGLTIEQAIESADEAYRLEQTIWKPTADTLLVQAAALATRFTQTRNELDRDRAARLLEEVEDTANGSLRYAREILRISLYLYLVR